MDFKKKYLKYKLKYLNLKILGGSMPKNKRVKVSPIFDALNRGNLQNAIAYLNSPSSWDSFPDLLNEVNEDGYTALMFVANQDPSQLGLTLINALLHRGADPNIRHKNGTTALIISVKKYWFDAFITLLNYNADPNIQDANKSTALMYAAENGANLFVRRLIEKGANVNIVNYINWTALIYASMNKQFFVVKELLKANADPNIKTKLGATALTFAIKHATNNIVKELLDANAHPNIRDIRGYTPLMLAVKRRGNEDENISIVEHLLNAKANILLKNNKDRNMTALDYAINESSYEIINILRENKKDVLKKSKRNKPY